MADETVPVEAAMAAFLARVLDGLLEQVGDEDAVRQALVALGVEGADIDAVTTYVAAQAAAVAHLADAVPPLLEQLARPDPDLVSLVGAATDAFQGATALAAGSPQITVPALPDAGTVLDTMLAAAVEHAVQTARPAAWAAMKSLHLLGPEQAVFTVVEDVLRVTDRFPVAALPGPAPPPRHHHRRHRHRPADGVGGDGAGLADRHRRPDLVRAKVPTADVVLQRITLRLAADTYDEPHAITIEVLGHDPGNGGPPGFAAVVRDLGGGRRARCSCPRR